MAYATPSGGRRGGSRRSQGRAGESRGASRGPVTSQGRRPAQARGGSANQYRSSRGYRGVGRRDSGYGLRQHKIRFVDHRSTLSRIADNPRAIVAIVVAIFLVVIAFVGISSCVRSCTSKSAGTASDQDARIAAGLTPELTDQLVARLDRDALVGEIALHADMIEDERMVELALKEEDAIPLVVGLTKEDVDYSPLPYDSEAARGAYPKIYDWDLRWGYVSFGNGMMALTGSGPTALSMAYIGLTGATDHSPADIAAAAVAAKATDETYGFTPAFAGSHAHELGLSFKEFAPSGETLSDVIESGTVVLLQLKSGIFGEDPHWALVIGENLDGSVNINDPASTTNSSRPWDPATVASASQNFFAITVAPKEEADGEGAGEGEEGVDASTDEATQEEAATTDVA